MRLIAIGFGKVKAVQCYVYLLVWLILVSIGLYWFLNRTGTGSLSALTQSGFGYGDNLNYNDGSAEGSDSTENKNRFYSNKNPTGKDTSKSYSLPATADKVRSLKTFELSYESTVRDNDKESESNHGKKYEDDQDGVYEIDGPNAAVTRLCNPVERIKAEDENVQVPDYKLEAVIILFRHGDRGPLTHIGHRNISHINCGAKSRDLDHLIKFATETLVKLPGYSQFVGPFNSFPKAPTSHHCSLGQLSQLGSAQLLTLGKMIRSTYKSTLVNLTTLIGSGTSSGVNSHPLKVTAYSTRYRRTFQSLIAFLFGLLGPKHLIQSTTIRESQSITFCFNDCSCRAADRLKKAAAKKYKPTQEHKSAMTSLVNQLNSVLGTDKSKKTGNSLLDSLLVYPCHKMELPCHEDNHKDRGVKLLYKAIKKFSTYPGSRPDLSCVSPDSLANLIKFIKTENFNIKKISENRNYHLLSSYGLLKEIVSLALKMTSSSSSDSSKKQQQPPQSPSHAASSSLSSSMMSANGNYFGKGVDSKTKLIIFSGHDTTLQSLTAALGIFSGHPDIELPPFSSRLIFEFYRRTNVPPNSPRKHYFRLIYNGISVTHLVSFCKDSNFNKYATTTNNDTNKTAKQSNGKKSKYYYKTHFCPIENLVRFIHDHYFDSFGNATNFKDACQM